MSSKLRFDDKVVVITGAGNGLGKAYALFFGGRGAKVVVNDLGVSQSGKGLTSEAADSVVDEIKKLGGEAVANYNSVEDGDKVIETAINTFGRIDVLINNAGILRDVGFKKMKKIDWDLIMKIHLNGTFSCTKAAFEHMHKQKYGRIINVTSPAGLYGSFGQVNYSTAKAGLIGFTKSLSKEISKYNILVNAIAPMAATKMTEPLLPKDILSLIKVDYMIPVIAYLSSEECKDSGEIIEMCGKWVSKVRWQRSEGVLFANSMTPEDVRDKWEDIGKYGPNSEYPLESSSSLTRMMELYDSNKVSDHVLLSDDLFKMIAGYLTTEEGQKLKEKIQSVYQFEILDKKNGELIKTWTIDLKENCNCVQGASAKYDTCFEIADEDFIGLLSGKHDPNTANLHEVMKIKGSLSIATKFTRSLFPKPTPENISKYQKAKF